MVVRMFFFLFFSIFFFAYLFTLPSEIIHQWGLGSPLTLEFLHTLQLNKLTTRIEIIKTLGVLFKIICTYGGNKWCSSPLLHNTSTLPMSPNHPKTICTRYDST